MAAKDCGVNWYKYDVLLVIDKLTDELATKIAFQVEAEAKPLANVDTGFMRNATYTIPATGVPMSVGDRSGRYTDKDGNSVVRTRNEEIPKIPEHFAAVHSAAEYAIYQEMTHPFLYPALGKVLPLVKGFIVEVARRGGALK